MMTNSTLLTGREIHALTYKYLEDNDVPAMKALVNQVFSTDYDEDVQDEVVHVILSSDNLPMAKACVGWDDIDGWCELNDEFVVLNCPQLFAAWASPTAQMVCCVGRALEQLPTQEKLAIIQGQSTLVAGTFLHRILTDKPEFWDGLKPSWIGDIDSPLRQASGALGWKHPMLPAMISTAWRSQVESWVNVMKYPYSLCVACDYVYSSKLRTLGPSKFSKSALSFPPVNVSIKADLRDVALSEILLERISMPHIVLHKHPDAAVLSDGERAELKVLVDIYVSLDCFDTLVDALCHDTIPGVQGNNVVELPLPDIDILDRG